ncbi:MAG: class I SAM-dependent methyltransferase [Patescibacteria group bacterium]
MSNNSQRETRYNRAMADKEARDEIKEVAHDSNRSSVDANNTKTAILPLREKIWETNEGRKRINGHEPEYVANGFGVSVEELFPPNGRTVYVGDPWQKLDRKGVVIVDYEFGPIAEFQDNREKYAIELERRINDIEARGFAYESETNDFLKRELATAKTLLERAKTDLLASFEVIGAEFQAMKQRIEEEIRRETGEQTDPIYSSNSVVRDLWYAVVHGARIVDVLDWETELRDKYEKFERTLPETMPQQSREKKLKNSRRELIESIRFEKTAKESDVVQAMFPFLPFADNSFDRFVAFWSISTYAFEHLTGRELTSYWKEIYRLLKPGGKAYIAPLFINDSFELESTLKTFSEKHSDFSFTLGDEYPPNELIIKKLP